MSQITAWRPGGVSRHLGRQLGRLHAVIYGLLLNGQQPPSDSKNTSIFTARTGFRTRALPAESERARAERCKLGHFAMKRALVDASDGRPLGVWSVLRAVRVLTVDRN